VRVGGMLEGVCCAAISGVKEEAVGIVLGRGGNLLNGLLGGNSDG